MVRSTVGGVLLVLVALVLLGTAVKAKPPDRNEEKPPDKDAPVWEWVLHDEKDKKVSEGHFVVRGFELWNGEGKHVGSYEDVGKDKDHVTVDIKEGKWLRGKFDLYLDKDKKSGDTWKGEMDNPKGSGKLKVVLVFKKFRK